VDSLKIAIVVHGRFHAFDLAHALVERGHDVTVFTNYPAYVAKRFGLAEQHVRSFLTHGILARGTAWARKYAGVPYPEAFLHRVFARWAARQVASERWDVVHSWSGISEELLRAFSDRSARTILMRGSSHVRVQDRLLREEEDRAGVSIDRPSSWVVEREEREYEYADQIAVLSSFAKHSFIEEGNSASRVQWYPLGVDNSDFRPSERVIERRCQRIRAGESLEVLFVGTLSYRKGMLDAIRIAEELHEESFTFRFVGPVSSAFRTKMTALKNVAQHVPNQPQNQLPEWYNRGDIFLFPTVEDGFAMVLTQAQAAGLPLLTTTNCAGPDLINEGKNGWVLPIRSPEAFTERLRWCDHHRDKLAGMVQHTYEQYRAKSWTEVGVEFERICRSTLSE